MNSATEKTQDYRPLAWIAAMALFMQSLDATILNTALPAISRSLNQSPLEMELAIISYALTVAAIIPLSGWIADRFGTLFTFRAAVFIFVLGSLACALSTNLDALVASRILQGVGGALMLPVARLAIIRNVEKSQLIVAWNLMAMSGLIGPVLGPILGGWIVTHASWPWIFLINLPIGIIGIIVVGKYMTNSYGNAGKLDWAGFLLFAAGLVTTTYGLDVIAENLANKSKAVILILSGIMLLIAYYLYALRAKNPLIPLSLLRFRTFNLGILGNLFIRISGSGIPFLLPLMWQVAFHFDAQTSGFMLAPIAISSILAKSVVTKILYCFGYRNSLVVNALLMAAAIGAMSRFTQDTPLWLYILIMMWYGCCISLMFTAVNTLAVCDLPDNLAGSGSTILSMMQQLGIGVGIAISSVVLALFREHFGQTGNLVSAFSHTFLVSSLFAVCLALLMARLHPEDGNNLRHRKSIKN
ncbi:DHA2 family efflux MFS transporter permease subunit [Bisgaard Taxon 10/6]|uniref:DHA2 family efflux MFS transporter permease subunit n=1 Tax=Exercitatus varius TaxID=67857 RepID=A0ABT6EVQ8_9PAST|nr:DHA2 family efflux MFS transporter permease subunit [Exercitatus varius]MDG2939214.1 DHA2 family efflux MFS transporter permease subunit [Exercitatus varius]MDG2946352.1 DHA2 family efflux MFS transporter permease subunit [Exercitatus varius]